MTRGVSHFRLGMCASILVLAACSAPATETAAGATGPATSASKPSLITVQAHVDAARVAAGDDLKALMVLCEPAPAARPAQEDSERSIAKLMAQPAPPPGRAFDNLYFVGAKWVSAWAIKTSDGIILIDALNNRREATDDIEAGLRQFGLDPAQIKYVLVTHGHGDHYGGATYLAERYQSKIVMSALDWQMTSSKLEFSSRSWDPPPVRNASRDLAVADGDRLTLGDETLTLYLTPGHTRGTLTPVFDVRANGRTYRAMEWGGTAFNFGNDIPRLDSYIAATERMRSVAEQQHVEVLISNHSGYDGSLEKLQAMRSQPAVAANPFVIGAPAVMRALTTMGECAKATRDRFTM